MIEPELMNAKTLLDKYLDLLGYTPDVAEWNEDYLGNNPPRLHRLKRLQALFAAFAIPWDLPAFRRGQFIDGGPRYQAVRERALADLPRARRDLEGEPDPGCLRFLFQDFLAYRERVDCVLLYHSGVGAASGYFAWACLKVREANDQIRQAIEPIDDLLAACISPTWQTFPREVLIRDFGYSDVDLWSIDADWA
jgi:hypothetical protein